MRTPGCASGRRRGAIVTVRAEVLAALAAAVVHGAPAAAQQPAASDSSRSLVLVLAAVWDGVADAPAPGWVVAVRGARISAAGPAERVDVPADAERVELPGTTTTCGSSSSWWSTV